jgi:hypothetical protein
MDRVADIRVGILEPASSLAIDPAGIIHEAA